ncbi:MAG: hypothetical protein ACHBN1_31425 [Heteroscytonema crispum UTEX LB 1556]
MILPEIWVVWRSRYLPGEIYNNIAIRASLVKAEKPGFLDNTLS